MPGGDKYVVKALKYNGVILHAFSLGVGDDKRADAHNYLSDGSGMTQEFLADGETLMMTSSTVMGAKSLSFKLGEAIDSITLERKVKVTFSVDGEKLVEKQSGDGFECQHVRQGSGNTLTMTLTGGGHTCIRTFVKL
ncbi:fatty acid-binding protein, liver-like [Mya arenaria]|uniref:fatty acid-binding protein, liver-like n=1 Tax=Mya arenaria TaxID=6604 RepID=UPI0022E45FCE|nr:fatty acid-binding protein, liver-like [Mya arenaria]